LLALIVSFSLALMLGCGGSGSSSSQQQTVTVHIASAPQAIGAGANWQYSASVNGTTNQTVTWSASAGTIDSTGLYIAPTSVPASPSVTITATAAADSSATDSTSITVQANDPLGSASASPLTCPTFSGGLPAAQSTCYQVNIACPGVANFSAYVKVNQPTSAPIGTVILGTGEGGSGLYDNNADFIAPDGTNGGIAVVNGLLTAGYTTAQVSFGAPFNTNAPNGWLSGPGGVRRLACRYATLAQWIQSNIHASTTIPLCATGNSGGAGAIGYALTEYGLDSIFTMVESTSGPPMSRLDQACVQPSACQSTAFTCNPGDQPENIHMCYSNSESQIIDPAYSQPICTNAINGTAPPNGLLLSDSILGSPTRTFSHAYVNVLVGGQDTSSAVDQALTWESSLTNTMKNQACVSDAPHALPSVQDGALRVVSDIQNFCKAPVKLSTK
jgi:hypothetical protein